MNLMGDGLAVLGSRIGLIWDPSNRKSFLVRHGAHPGIPLEIHAGIKIKDKTICFPLSLENELFGFLDQDNTPSTIKLSGVDPETGIHVKLTVRIPFRPRDFEFSTIPVLLFDVSVERFSSQFRWTESVKDEKIEGKVFIEFGGSDFTFAKNQRSIEVSYTSVVKIPDVSGVDMGNFEPLNIKSKDRIVPISGSFDGMSIYQNFSLARGEKSELLSAAWCTYDPPVLNVIGDRCPFLYLKKFKSVDDVENWILSHSDELRETNTKVDSLFASHNLGDSVTRMMSYTLHSWLINTWLVDRPDGRKWLSVWEGSCYFHSTVDVEYTQSPFYLSVWPELLALQLDEWPYFGKDASVLLGDSGKDLLFLSHDIGYLSECTKQYYPHEMEVEENANYIQLAYAYWRRTGDDSLIKKHEQFIYKLLNFILACDTTGNGIPDKGCANTIDDASPAIQFGSEQVYLGVKAMTAVRCGIEIFKYLGKPVADYENFVKKAVDTIESRGWVNDHYVVTLTRTLDGIINPWSGEEMSGELEGWDAYHIYTSNGIAIMRMVGMENVLDESRLKSDLINSLVHTKGKYGCRHTSYVNTKPTNLLVPGLAGSAPKVGWVSMNMIRDIAAAYHGVDMFSMVQNYWDWQVTSNSQQVFMFFETFYGNNLNFYPRGLAVFGYLEAAAGFSLDTVSGRQNTEPVRNFLEVPLLYFANWNEGKAPVVKSSDDKIKIKGSIEKK